LPIEKDNFNVAIFPFISISPPDIWNMKLVEIVLMESIITDVNNLLLTLEFCNLFSPELMFANHLSKKSMEPGYRSQNLDVAHFGSFPSVNPVLKQETEQNKKELEESALGIACAQGEYESVRKLIEQGVDINKKDPANFSPIMRAATNGHKNIVEFLVNCRAKISYNLLCSVKTKIELMEELAQRGNADPYDVADWKNLLDFLIAEGKKQ